MNEYYCTNCGADLEEQDGFDPSDGVWTCRECGTLLMDDDVYSGDKYNGIAWFCDNCNALLNRQDGFSDTFDSWTCLECGYTNGITEDDIINNNDSSNPEGKDLCPNCDANLSEQSGYYEYNNDWTCTECGSMLHRDYSDDEFSIVEKKNICPNCDAILSDQSGYYEYDNDWTCTECGSMLHRNYSDDEFSIVEKKNICPNCDAILSDQSGYYEYDNDWTCTECGSMLHRDYFSDEFLIVGNNNDNDENQFQNSLSDNSYSSYDNDNIRYYSKENPRKEGFDAVEKTKQEEQLRRKKTRRKKHRKAVNVVISLCIIALFCVVGYYEYSIRIPVGYNKTELIDNNYHEVVRQLKRAGFKYVNEEAVKDLSIDDISKDYSVADVKIGWSSSFDKDSKYPLNFPVTVKYHTLETVGVPISSKDAKKSDYNTVLKLFEDAGFVKIKTEKEYDIITGWLKDDGDIKSVTINGEKNFNKGDAYRVDAEIVIIYHTLKKNKPK